jgi:hypothetical protein
MNKASMRLCGRHPGPDETLTAATLSDFLADGSI